MASANNNNFTRGAQLWAHNMRMALQGAKNICFLGLAFVLVLLAIRCYQYLTLETVYYFLIQCYVEFKLTFGVFFYPKHLIGIDYYSLGKGVFVHVSAEQFVYEFWHRTKYSVILYEFISWATHNALFEILVTFAAGCIFALILFTYRGHDILGVKKLRGSELVTAAQLRRILKRAGQAFEDQDKRLATGQGFRNPALVANWYYGCW